MTNSLGWILQKKAKNKAQLTGEKNFKSPVWWIGVLSVIFSILCFIASAALMKISALGALLLAGIVCNILFGRIFLKENFTKCKIIAMGMLIIGLILTLKYTSMETPKFNREEFEEWIYHPLVIGYFISNLIVILIGFPICHYI